MPKLLDIDMETGAIPGLNGYAFSGVQTNRLGASEYTLVTIAVDKSTSVIPFRDLLIDTIKKAVGACKKSPRAANILLRVIAFNHDVEEVHGFRPLVEIDVDRDYEGITPRGNTALFDASASAIGATVEYGRKLAAQDFAVNGILFVITDGEDTGSTFLRQTVAEKSREATDGEQIESFLSVLIGVNAARCRAYLENFRDDGGFTQYIDAGDATPGNLAKLAAFVSRSVSSQANAQGTGAAAGPVSF